jgi:4-azaleucine resistance transporter AzlC
MKFTQNFLSGSKKGLAIALGYIPIAITFGLIANSSNIPGHITIMMSLLVFAGASQFIAVNLLKLGTGAWGIIITTFIVNLRHFLMSASISQRIKHKVPKKWMPLLAFGITDETFSFISLSPKEKLNTGFILGINTIAYSAWVLGTIAGIYLGKGLPEIMQDSMGIALYAMFIGLLLPNIKKHRIILIISLLTVGVSSFLYWNSLISIPKSWQIIITTILASIIGAVLFPEEVDEIE